MKLRYLAGAIVGLVALYGVIKGPGALEHYRNYSDKVEQADVLEREYDVWVEKCERKDKTVGEMLGMCGINRASMWVQKRNVVSLREDAKKDLGQVVEALF